jgi:hypothetical protein
MNLFQIVALSNFTQIFSLSHQQLERAVIFDKTMFMTLTLVLCIVLYALSGYLRTAILAMKIPGPRAYPIIGNCLFAAEPDSE